MWPPDLAAYAAARPALSHPLLGSEMKFGWADGCYEPGGQPGAIAASRFSGRYSARTMISTRRSFISGGNVKTPRRFSGRWAMLAESRAEYCAARPWVGAMGGTSRDNAARPRVPERQDKASAHFSLGTRGDWGGAEAVVDTM